MSDQPEEGSGATLDEMVFREGTRSREGVSLDYMSRVRIAFLLGQNQSMITQTQFADAKAGALLAFVGLVATRGPGSAIDITAVTPLVLLQVALHGAALISAIIVLYPRYAGRDARRDMSLRDRYSWPALTTDALSDEDYAHFARTAELSQFVVSIARSNHALSRILLQKFNWLRAAFLIAVADVALLALRVAIMGSL